MKRVLTVTLLALASLPLSACVADYGFGGPAVYGPEPYAYDGWYDGYYGPVNDGYWGDDGYFYYRHGDGDRAYVRGDRTHFVHQAPQGPHNYQPLHGSVSPRQGVRMPHFPRGNNAHH